MTVLTPRDVAARWGCSEQHIRNMVRDGRLRAFRLGGKLLRIAEDAVREVEQCQITVSSSTEANGASTGVKDESLAAARRARLTVRKPSYF